jgi:hypothetical protein
MDAWRARVSGFLRKWQQARNEVKRAKNARRDAAQAEELDMVKKGLSRRPGGFL